MWKYSKYCLVLFTLLISFVFYMSRRNVTILVGVEDLYEICLPHFVIFSEHDWDDNQHKRTKKLTPRRLFLCGEKNGLCFNCLKVGFWSFNKFNGEVTEWYRQDSEYLFLWKLQLHIVNILKWRLIPQGMRSPHWGDLTNILQISGRMKNFKAVMNNRNSWLFIIHLFS